MKPSFRWRQVSHQALGRFGLVSSLSYAQEVGNKYTHNKITHLFSPELLLSAVRLEPSQSSLEFGPYPLFFLSFGH